MDPKVIVPVIGLLVTLSANAALEGVVKLATPNNLSALSKFGIKIGSSLVIMVISGKITEVATKNTKEIIETVQNVGKDVIVVHETTPEAETESE